ncbi:TPR repeat containing exported protein; Putative periplasmic protein contains a protein prenylyltransferase domain [hydrothermal vent metagenome]|uniref:TPR repeat containing exported protein Putative periplasmic protein contains a protein prenylyltransferase domain n=1 Tax=hydrothermal vent metagenome TaxID=652676 RepID=A0A3B0WZU4_9ZZZZ
MKSTRIKISMVSAGVSLALMVSSFTVLAAPPQSSVEDRLQRIERIIENPVLLQLSRRLGDQQREIQELQDQIDFLKRDLRKMNSRLDKRYKETDERLSSLEEITNTLKNQSEQSFDLQSQKSLSLNTVNDIRNEKESVLTETPDNVSTPEKQANNMKDMALEPIVTRPATEEESDAYHVAFDLIKKAQYDEAITAFQGFLVQYPQSKLASNASYWAGEAFYIKQDYQAALNAFNVVIKRYSSSSKVADAMLRAGDCLDNLKQLNEAKNIYASLIAIYPKTRAAEKAIKRLTKLR